MQVAILGRQPALSLAELESIYGAKNITRVSDEAALVVSNEVLPQSRLGGTVKSAKLLTRLENTDLASAFKYLHTTLPEHAQLIPEGKLQLGVSVYGFKAEKSWLLKQMLSLKKIIKNSDRSVRIIENKAESLEVVQVLYNKLTGPLGMELILIKDGADTLLAQTTAVQDIDAYSERDFGRPKRDTYVGMLPPKLAQIMINLAPDSTKIADSEQKTVLLDPFCGTGVVLQEAMLLGYEVYGTDLSEKMVRYSRDNLNWLQDSFTMTRPWRVEIADATDHTWRQPLDLIVCETYLGTPLTALPRDTELTKITTEANTIAEEFLKNIVPQLKKGTRLCLALPAWHLGNEKFLHLKVLDHLTDLGYNRLEFVHASSSELIYHRTDQIVARELTILEKN